MAVLLAATPAVAGVNIRIYRQSLKDVSTRWTIHDTAPQTTWRLAGRDEASSGGDSKSTFGPAGGQDTVFRQAEVSPDRIGLTKTLMSDLKARTTPSQAIVVDLPADVLFDFDKATLRPDAAEPLRKANDLLASYPTAPVTINGHTDSKGDDTYNQALSTRRATSVAQYLKSATNRSFVVNGLGESQPVAPNAKPDGADDPDGRQKNRRVEIIIAPPLKR